MAYNVTTITNTNNVDKLQSMAAIISTYKQNFLMRDIEIVPGLLFNQYNTIKRVYYYLHNQFESGPFDELGQPKYFFDLMTDRNDQATKNIDLDTKDCYIKAENGGSYLLSWLLRMEFSAYAKETQFGKMLNDLSDDLPDFGTVVWKKCKGEDGYISTQQVDLINIINDPQADCLEDGIMIERHLMTQSEMRKMKVWNQDAVEALIKSGRTTIPTRFMTATSSEMSHPFNQIDTITPYYEVYEYWGEIPKYLYDMYQKTIDSKEYIEDQYNFYPTQPDVSNQGSNEMVYVMAQVAGVEPGSQECVLYMKETPQEKFPYKEVHFRRRKGRWLGLGNYELCFDQIEKANEVTNRFFASLRLSLMHLYQTRDALHVKNVMSDLLDGDIIVSKSDISLIPTEIRGLSDYRDEIERIENKCNHLCNTFEVVTGENLPSGTSALLGNQMQASATKLFEYIRQNIGLFIENVFNEWLLPGFADRLTVEHTLELLDTDDLKIYYETIKRKVQYDAIKKFILSTNDFPAPEQLELVGNIAKDQLTKMPKQLLVEEGTYDKKNALKYKLKVIITDENNTKKQNLETLQTLAQTAMANPQGLQDERVMKIIGMTLEEAGFSPLQFNMVNQTPTNPSLNPANQGGAPVANRDAGAINNPQQMMNQQVAA